MDNNKIVSALRLVKDPASGIDIIQKKMVSHLKVTENQVSFTLQVSQKNEQVKTALHQACVQTIQREYPDADVHIHLSNPAQSGAPQNNLSQVKNIIAIASGKGGVGKSTVSINLALGLKNQGFKVGLMDADLYGPSAPTMLGVTGERPQVQQLYGQNKILPIEAHGISMISIGNIIDPEQAVVLRGPRLGGIIKQFVHDCLWPELDYLIIDLPPGTGDIQLTMVQTLAITGAVIVTTPQELAVIDAVKAMNMFLLPNVNVPIVGVVENMSWFTPKELPDNKYYIFGKGGGDALSRKGKCSLLAKIPLVQSVREAGDSGKPAILSGDKVVSEPFEKLAENLVRQVNLRNEMRSPTERVLVN